MPMEEDVVLKFVILARDTIWSSWRAHCHSRFFHFITLDNRGRKGGLAAYLASSWIRNN